MLVALPHAKIHLHIFAANSMFWFFTLTIWVRISKQILSTLLVDSHLYKDVARESLKIVVLTITLFTEF